MLRYFLPLSLFTLLLFIFQNCGVPLEEMGEESNESSGLDTYDYNENLLRRNADGTYSFPLPGEPGSSGSGASDGSAGNTDLGGGSSGNGSSDSYNPYETNYRTSSLYPAKPSGNHVLARSLYAFVDVGRIEDAEILWSSFSKASASWIDQEMGTKERKELLVVSMNLLSQGSSQASFGFTGTSLCHKFSGQIVAPRNSQNYTFTVRTGSRGDTMTYQLSGYQATLSGLSVTPKTAEELTQLETAACQALAGYDRRSIDGFIQIIKRFNIFKPSGPDLQVGRAGSSSSFFDRAYMTDGFKAFAE